MTSIPNSHSNASQEIDLVELVGYVWSKRKFVFLSFLFSLIIGILLAFSLRVEFKTSISLLNEGAGSSRNLGGLGDLAGLAGIRLNDEQGGLSPGLYSTLVASDPFMMDMLKLSVPLKSSDTVVSLSDYLIEISDPNFFDVIRQYTIGLPSLLISKVESKVDNSPDNRNVHTMEGVLSLTPNEHRAIETLKKRVDVEVSGSLIIISAQLPDGKVAAFLVNEIYKKLASEVTRYNIEKSKIDLEFIQDRFFERKKNFEEVQGRLATFVDQNKNIKTSIAQVQLQKLQNEYNLAFETFRTLAQQLEQAQLKVQDDTPVFTVLEPSKVPISKYKPNRMLIISVISLFGMFSCIFFFISYKIFYKMGFLSKGEL